LIKFVFIFSTLLEALIGLKMQTQWKYIHGEVTLVGRSHEVLLKSIWNQLEFPSLMKKLIRYDFVYTFSIPIIDK